MVRKKDIKWICGQTKTHLGFVAVVKFEKNIVCFHNIINL